MSFDPVSAKRSKDIFADLIWPIWRGRLEGSELVSVECSEHYTDGFLDYSGVDAFFRRKGSQIPIPLASRTEFAKSENADTRSSLPRRFTIRYQKLGKNGWHSDTEFGRLTSAVRYPECMRFLPFRHIHSFIWDKGGLPQLVCTHSICSQTFAQYLARLQSEKNLDITQTRRGDAKFVRVYLDRLNAAGVSFLTLP